MEPETPAVADRRELILSSSELRLLQTRVAGLFLFLPLLARLGFHKLVHTAGYPGSEMVPADAALLSLLTLKLLDKERKSHIDDFILPAPKVERLSTLLCRETGRLKRDGTEHNFDEAAGLFAGLNILPKKSFASDYSYRTNRGQQQRLLAGWVKHLSPVLLPAARAFSLDFHPIPYRGEQAVLENHYLPSRGQAGPSVQSYFAQDHENQVFCYANANLTRDEQAGEITRFVDFWQELTGHDPQCFILPAPEVERLLTLLIPRGRTSQT